MHLRPYQPSDLAGIRNLFRTTIERVNWRDYTAEQLQAWIGTDNSATQQQWQDTLSTHRTLVAIDRGTLVGFGDMTTTGLLDRLYVHYAHQNRGIATALVRTLEADIPAATYQTYASITARPFFERQGYQVTRTNHVQRQGVDLLNYHMQK
ncbi:MAG TPA: GNAT family N-acetyltransferase [Candidatus Levilactobacillus faecigallinarum]|uniref:GNAT family N-acetyltransferase n=1 Tax=Candidatus Levilactobacillus faecigallinarum TaxID=2838638 RepID=A0A9D1QS39_9LACO|nr:GNAT family N-acetyltransferase [Candidatus Levilactobacillus faecigallinarum]